MGVFALSAAHFGLPRALAPERALGIDPPLDRPTLFCFLIYQAGVEDDLVKYQYDQKIGIFACDGQAIFSLYDPSDSNSKLRKTKHNGCKFGGSESGGCRLNKAEPRSAQPRGAQSACRHVASTHSPDVARGRHPRRERESQAAAAHSPSGQRLVAATATA